MIIQDDVQLAFESVLDFSSFAIRIPQKDMHNVRGQASAAAAGLGGFCTARISRAPGRRPGAMPPSAAKWRALGLPCAVFYTTLQVPQILEAVPEERVVQMQKALGQVWRR